ncbi:MAG: SAM-dependent methyltransferase, partial [Cyanobacteria bacterium J06643_4]
MVKSKDGSSAFSPMGDVLNSQAVSWVPMLSAAAQRFDQEYRGEPFDLPEEVEALPVFRDWAAGSLNSR